MGIRIGVLDMKTEDIVKEFEKAKSILMLLMNDLDNPSGSNIESVQINALECAIDQMNYSIEMLEQSIY